MQTFMISFHWTAVKTEIGKAHYRNRFYRKCIIQEIIMGYENMSVLAFCFIWSTTKNKSFRFIKYLCRTAVNINLHNKCEKFSVRLLSVSHSFLVAPVTLL